MSADVAKVLAETDRWPVADRVELLHQLWDRLAETGTVSNLSDAQKAEFDRRLADLDANPDDLLTWDEVSARLRLPQ